MSRISKLQNCAGVYSITQGQASCLGDSITIDGVKNDVLPQQKDLVDKLVKEVHLDNTEAFKIVTQAGRLGIVDLDGLVKGYMDERTALLEVVKCLLTLESHGSSNSKTAQLAEEVVLEIKKDEGFLSKVMQGIWTRVGQHLPSKAAFDPSTALLWSRQVRQIEFSAHLDIAGGISVNRDCIPGYR